LSYFFTSAYVDNTVLIITTDHATYAEPPVIAALKNEQNYQKHFVDMIPLLIHSPYHEMPERYDAKTRTSIDFTPSILHLLDIKKYESSFLGHSIFSPKKQNHIAVGAIGHNYYYINEKKEVVKVKPNQHINYGFERYKSAIKTYYDLEPNNKIYKE
jgi:phosphoglycerol transferase MdoB-like AlkP superfamily enzyme